MDGDARRGGAAHGPTGSWWYHPALDALTDLVVVIDGDGTVLHANPFVEELLGVPRGEGVGESIATYVHPDDLERAAEVLAMVSEQSLGVALTPAVYRIRAADGTWTPVELNATLHDNGEGDQILIIVGRYSGDRALQDRIVERLIAGDSPSDVVELVPEFGAWRHPDDHYAVIFTGDDGDVRAVGSPVAVELADLDVREAPWTASASREQELVVAARDLPGRLRAAARAEGLGSCWVVPVADPLHASAAVMVAWCREGAGGPAVHRYALETMGRALRLILQWRQQVTDLRTAARRDPLTGLPNRTRFFEVLDDLRSEAGGDGIAMLYVDLDGFKAVNDQHGHLVGDQVLVDAADRIAGVLRPRDTVARLGGDEFAVLCQDLGGDTDAGAIADRIVQAFEAPFLVGSHRVRVGASVGVATMKLTELDGETLLDLADRALYEAKHAGRGRWQLAGP